MFSRNEKYGQALHLQYGFGMEAQKPVQQSENSILAKLKAVFQSTDVTDLQTTAPTEIEIDLGRTSIEQAVQAELRNTDAAANENQLHVIEGKIA